MEEVRKPIADMSAEELRHIARKLTTYAGIYTGDKEAREMARRCLEIADLLDAASVAGHARPRCDLCQHWTEDEESWEAEGIGFKRCDAIRERWKIQDAIEPRHSGEQFIAARKTALQSSRAYVEDGSEYKALLWTAPDFFCALFSASLPQPPQPIETEKRK